MTQEIAKANESDHGEVVRFTLIWERHVIIQAMLVFLLLFFLVCFLNPIRTALKKP